MCNITLSHIKPRMIGQLTKEEKVRVFSLCCHCLMILQLHQQQENRVSLPVDEWWASSIINLGSSQCKQPWLLFMAWSWLKLQYNIGKHLRKRSTLAGEYSGQGKIDSFIVCYGWQVPASTSHVSRSQTCTCQHLHPWVMMWIMHQYSHRYTCGYQHWWGTCLCTGWDWYI